MFIKLEEGTLVYLIHITSITWDKVDRVTRLYDAHSEGGPVYETTDTLQEVEKKIKEVTIKGDRTYGDNCTVWE